MKNKKIIFVIISLIVLSIILLFVYNKKYSNNNNVSNELSENIIYNEEIEEEIIQEEEKELQIYKGNDRPIAVIIDNERPAWPHSGLQDAYMIYEMIIEGGETRMLALFKNQTTEKIGPIRSTRHYFVHYAMEHNAIFAHFGWSPKAEETIKQYRVNNINGIYDTFFWRVGSGYHNAFSSMERIKKAVSNKKYNDKGTNEPIYNYDVKEINIENSTEISGLKVTYSNLHNVSYKYNSDEKVFYRSMRGVMHKDRDTGKQYYAKNIICMYIENYNLADSSNKGRQELKNIGSGTGHYITNGEYIDITWRKSSEKEKTKWFDKSGDEIVLNDGITFVQLIPAINKVEFDAVNSMVQE